MRVVLPAPLTPIRQVSTPGRNAPLIPLSSSSWGLPLNSFTLSPFMPCEEEAMLTKGKTMKGKAAEGYRLLSSPLRKGRVYRQKGLSDLLAPFTDHNKPSLGLL